MACRHSRIFLFLLLAVLVFPQTAAAGHKKPRHKDFIVRASAQAMDEILWRHGLEEIEVLEAAAEPGERVVVVRADEWRDRAEVLEGLASEIGVVAVEEVYLASLPELDANAFLDQSTTAILDALQAGDDDDSDRDSDFDSRTNQLWQGYAEQPAAWLVGLERANKKYKGKGATVAVIDSGIDTEHPLLKKLLVEGYDFLLDRPGFATDRVLLDQSTMAILDQSTMAILDQSTVAILDQSTMAILDQSILDQLIAADAVFPASFGHGTMVAGIIHLVAPEAKLLPLRVFNGAGTATTSDIAKAIYWAVDHGATAINMSFSLGVDVEELSKAIEYAHEHQVICVAAAGNLASEMLVYPAADEEVIGVAATDAADYLTSFSNYGNDLATLAAPGHTIITSFVGGGWAAGSGTSYSAPWISGVVALFSEKSGKSSTVDLEKALEGLQHADEINGEFADKVGYGRADLERAVRHFRDKGGEDSK